MSEQRDGGRDGSTDVDSGGRSEAGGHPQFVSSLTGDPNLGFLLVSPYILTKKSPSELLVSHFRLQRGSGGSLCGWRGGPVLFCKPRYSSMYLSFLVCKMGRNRACLTFPTEPHEDPQANRCESCSRRNEVPYLQTWDVLADVLCSRVSQKR